MSSGAVVAAVIVDGVMQGVEAVLRHRELAAMTAEEREIAEAAFAARVAGETVAVDQGWQDVEVPE